MKRGWFPITALLLLASCGASTAPPAYPREVAGGYRLFRENVLTGEQIPKGAPASGLIRAVRLMYDASNAVQVTVFETQGSAVALDAMQKWQAQSGYHAALKGRYFFIAQGEKPDASRIEAFLADFEKQLK